MLFRVTHARATDVEKGERARRRANCYKQRVGEVGTGCFTFIWIKYLNLIPRKESGIQMKLLEGVR